MHIVSLPKLLQKLICYDAIWQIATNKKVIFLTFDDGPLPETTPTILEILKQYKAKATFFCVGENIQKHSSEFNSILSSGHLIGNHTYNHLNGWKTESCEYIDNFNLFESFYSTKLFRPPYGRIKTSQINTIKKQHQIILWSVLSGDYDTRIDSKICLKNVLRHSKNGSIVVFHDSKKAIEKIKFVLPKFIEQFQEKGFLFESLNSDWISLKEKIN